MFTLFNSMRPNSLTTALVDRQVQRWQAAQDAERREQLLAISRPRESAQARLSSSPYLPLRGLQCEGNGGHLVLRGRVPTRYLKDLSARLVKSTKGVECVSNEVEVLPLGCHP